MPGGQRATVTRRIMRHSILFTERKQGHSHCGNSLLQEEPPTQQAKATRKHTAPFTEARGSAEDDRWPGSDPLTWQPTVGTQRPQKEVEIELGNTCSKGKVFYPERKLLNILGIMTEVSRISRQDKLPRKKYMRSAGEYQLLSPRRSTHYLLESADKQEGRRENSSAFVLLRFRKPARIDSVIPLLWFPPGAIIFPICAIAWTQSWWGFSNNPKIYFIMIWHTAPLL